MFIKSTSPTTTTIGMYEGDAIEPQVQAPIKVLSNLKDKNTGEISKPFTIAGKTYQMVRARMNNEEISYHHRSKEYAECN